MRGDEDLRRIPVVVLSIICDEGKSERCGAAGYLEKPIDKNRLIGVIDGLVGSIAAPVVLVVDDDKQIVDLLCHTLKQRGYTVMGAYDGREAMAAVRRTKPDAILLDLRMPVMDGYAVLEELKTSEETMDIPVVIMSAYPIDRERSDVLALATERVSKPFDVEAFVTRVESVMTEDGEA
jgi:CheY-like chemotaxis protein